MSSQVTLQANGLNFSPNNLSLPQGSLLVADDVIIRRDNIVQKRRGFNQYSEGLGITTDRIKQLIEYKGRILANYANKLAFDTLELNTDGKSVYDDFAGTYSDASTGLRMKSIEANKNLYFTTSEGIKRISARTADDFTTASGFIKEAGAIQALDFTANLQITQGETSGFLPSDSAVAYRTVWGYKDLNDVIVLGVPSERVVIYNYLINQMAMDLNALCVVLDTINQSPCMITDGDYATSFYTPVNSTGETLLNNVLQLAEKLDLDIIYADQGGSAPLDMADFKIVNNEVTITFDAGMTPESYLAVDDVLDLANFTSYTYLEGQRTLTSVYNSNPSADPDLSGKPTISFTLTHVDVALSAIDAASTMTSYNYRNITGTGDVSYTTPLSDLVLSIPPTSEELRTINNTLYRISERLKVELPGVIPTSPTDLQALYVTPFTITEKANVLLTITIPSNIDSSYFFQVYRTDVFTADGVQTLGDNGGVPVIPGDEMRLVYEAFPTSAEISAEEVSFLDTSPEELVQNNANLYTNPETGDGILQANYQPPFAKDINTFKNYTFYANTATNYQIPILQLLGVSNISNGDTITISNGTDTNTYTFTSGVQQVTDILYDMSALTASDYITLYSANDEHIYDLYYVIDGVGTAPVNAGHIAVPVDVLSTFTSNQLAQKSIDVINTLVYDFEVAANTLPTIRITNVAEGITTTATATVSSGTPFTISVTTPGNGEDAASEKVLLSSLVSAAQAIDETARSLVRVINKQSDSPVDAYYISGDNTPPGQINLKNKRISDPAFYVITSSVDSGLSFNPDLSPENTDITAIDISYTFTVTSANATAGATYTNNGQTFTVVDTISSGTTLLTTATGAPLASGTLTLASGSGDATITFTSEVASHAIVSTSSPHGLINNDQIVIGGTNSTPSINGLQTVTVLSTTTFTVPVVVTVSGNTGVWTKASEIPYSTNEVRKNRIYYSKLNQPDAVPLLNYLNVGAEDKEILRIFPLRDSLFIFKEDGTFRISGETAPFTLALFDKSCVVTAPDSVALCNNQIYAWTLKGITRINETGADDNVSRPIDTEILRLGSSAFPDFTTLTWGVGYDSDNTYTVYTNSSTEDTVATIGFTYNNLTNTWTNVVRTQTCGIILHTDDKLYMGAGDHNYIQRERKNFDRTDYADDDFQTNLAGESLFNNNLVMKLISVSNIDVGDVLVQEQDLTIFLFNKTLLELDNDPTIQDDDYFASLEAIPGDNMRDKIEALATKLDADPSLSGGYYNLIDTKSGSISSNAVGNPTTVTTSAAHELVNGRIITVSGTQSPQSSPVISGDYTVSNTGTFGVSDTFQIDVDVITAGGSGLSFTTADNEAEFGDIKACYNALVTRLNSDPGATYSTYQEVTSTTPFEAVVTAVNTNTKKITLNIPLQWVVGPITVYKAIDGVVVYSPESFGDQLMDKQIRDATIMLESRAITEFSAYFSSDLIPEFFEIPFTGSGNGIFGSYSSPGFGYGFFGGVGNAAPFRTLIPPKVQRCRYILVKVEHSVAREKFILNGVTLTGEIGKSSRSYR